jgi:hypothetical protein
MRTCRISESSPRRSEQSIGGILNDRQVIKAISLVLSSSRLLGLIIGFLNQT